MSEFRADLHCHSTCSDGTLMPQELIKHAIEIGLKGLSITDHDTVDAYNEALPFAKSLQFDLIPGVEFSAMHKNATVHILGYAFHLNDAELLSFCKRHTERRSDRNQQILQKLAKMGIKITEEDIRLANDKLHSIGRPHIAQAMRAKGYVQSIQDAFKKYIGEGKPAYASGESFSVEETLERIHRANGLAVIAHPHLIDDQRILKGLLDMNFDGIECFYSKFSREHSARWIEIAQKKNWLMTGGSDFHGSVKPNVPLGCSWVNEETFLKLKNWVESGLQ